MRWYENASLEVFNCRFMSPGRRWSCVDHRPPNSKPPPRPSCFMAVVKRVQVKLQTTPEEAFKFVARVEVML